MSKLTILQLLNKIEAKVGILTPSTSLAALTGRSSMAFNCLQEAVKEIYSENSARWKFAEKQGTITLSSGTNSYTGPTDKIEEDIYSFRSEDEENNIDFCDSQEFYREHKKVSDIGFPDKFTKIGDNLYIFDRIAGDDQNGKIIKFNYWEIPSLVMSTATGTFTATIVSTGTVSIPEIFEESVLVNLAVYKQLKYEGDSEAQLYHIELYGGPGKEGSFVKMKRIYGSNKLNQVRVTYYF